MSKRKYLVLFRNEPSESEPGPTPEQVPQVFAAYKAWMERFREDIVDLGDKLKSGGRVVTASGVADGPFLEIKCVVDGYMIVSADNWEGAVKVVSACPAVQTAGATLEIRELTAARM